VADVDDDDDDDRGTWWQKGKHSASWCLTLGEI
jgi:hypothetical protein